MNKYKCTAFMMHGCQKYPDTLEPLICCKSCTQNAECKFACMNSPTKCSMGKIEPHVKEPKEPKKRRHRPVKITNVETGDVKIYDSVPDAAEKMHCGVSSLYHYIRTGKIAFGCKWEYLHQKHTI